MRGLKLLLAAGALGLATAGIAVGAKGSSSSSLQVTVRSAEGAVPALSASQQQAADDYARLPVSFVEDQGQTDARVRYLAQGHGFRFFMTPSEVMLSFAKDSRASETPQGLALALRFVGGNPKVEHRVPSARPA
jgi:hypothetical protein